MTGDGATVAAAPAGVVPLPGLVLPPALGLARDHCVPARSRGPGYDDRYDFQTLAYDALHLPAEGAVRLYCPRLLNLRRVLRREARFRLDGAPVRLGRIRRFDRYDVAALPAAGAPARLALALRGWEAELPVSRSEPEAFAGRNVLLTISRDNALDWIADWARFHVREQGADAVLLVDNGSRRYAPEAVLDALGRVAGLRAVRVLAAPFPFGPLGLRPHRHDAKFLRPGLTNLVRDRFLAAARAVLVCDVDELVVTRESGPSVFDAAAAAPAGYLHFPGRWVLPRPGEGPVRHRDHVLGAAGGDCPAKYCVVPSGRLGHRSWSTHGLSSLLLRRRFATSRFGFLHCAGISDFWKGGGSRPAEAGADPDPEADAVLDRALGGSAGR